MAASSNVASSQSRFIGYLQERYDLDRLEVQEDLSSLMWQIHATKGQSHRMVAVQDAGPRFIEEAVRNLARLLNQDNLSYGGGLQLQTTPLGLNGFSGGLQAGPNSIWPLPDDDLDLRENAIEDLSDFLALVKRAENDGQRPTKVILRPEQQNTLLKVVPDVTDNRTGLKTMCGYDIEVRP